MLSLGRILSLLQLLLPLDLAEQVFASVDEAVDAVHDTCFLAASETTAWCPSDAPVEGMRIGIRVGKRWFNLSQHMLVKARSWLWA